MKTEEESNQAAADAKVQTESTLMSFDTPGEVPGWAPEDVKITATTAVDAEMNEPDDLDSELNY